MLDRVKEVDALIIGTPVYYGCETASTRALLERLCFPYLTYSLKKISSFPRAIKTGLIYTMNVNDEFVEELSYNQFFGKTKSMLEMHLNGPCELLLSTDTLPGVHTFPDTAGHESVCGGEGEWGSNQGYPQQGLT